MAALQSTEPVLDEETYDDTDFYELLLRDLIESNSTADRAPTPVDPLEYPSPPRVPITPSSARRALLDDPRPPVGCTRETGRGPVVLCYQSSSENLS